MQPGAMGQKIKGKKIRGVPNWTHLGEIHLYKAGRSLYWERPAVFMLQQARLVELPALSAIQINGKRAYPLSLKYAGNRLYGHLLECLQDGADRQQ